MAPERPCFKVKNLSCNILGNCHPHFLLFLNEPHDFARLIAFAVCPVIIKNLFWQMTAKNPDAIYACINQGQAVCPQEIERQSVYINADIGQVLQSLSDAAIQ